VAATSGAQISIAGSGFIASSTLTASGTSVTISSVISNQIVATIPASLLSIAGTLSVVVSNPAPGGGTATANLPVQPALLSVEPSTVVTGSTISVAVNGANSGNLSNDRGTFVWRELGQILGKEIRLRDLVDKC
jgi:hypothetical protein